MLRKFANNFSGFERVASMVKKYLAANGIAISLPSAAGTPVNPSFGGSSLSSSRRFAAAARAAPGGEREPVGQGRSRPVARAAAGPRRPAGERSMTRRSDENRGTGRLIATAALATGVAVHGEAAAEASIRLTISGLAPGAAYAGTCRLEDAHEIAIEGAQAASYEFASTSLSCEIDATAPLTIIFEKAGSRTRTRTSGGRVRVGMS
jgi:hypothetical protein